ncbi:MAG: TIGR03905 family TSCPD domain-containing protein [Erysipelotrichaceae bacterium]|nr:TIGR03905 family TSCPD domain-containing protein [Erysipelotrichaceae bacterium]
MKKHFEYIPQGVCSSKISFDIEDGVVHNVVFLNGCRGNTQGVANLSEGMEAKEIIRRLKGVMCRNNTSCPNEFAKALEACINSAN